MESGESKWILMLIPETGAGLSGFVSPPQDSKHLLHGLEMRPQNLEIQLNQAVRMTKLAHEAIMTFRDETIASVLLPAEKMARKNGETVVDLMLAEFFLDASARENSISTIFNKAVSDDPNRQKLLDTSVIPAINSVVMQLRSTFEEAIKPEQSFGEHCKFFEFFNGKNMTRLQSRIATLPIDEAAQAHKVFKKINSTIQNYSNQSAEVNQGEVGGSSVFLPGNCRASAARATL